MRSSSPRLQLGLASTAVLLTAADTYVVVLALTDMMAGVGLGIESLHRATPIISGFLVGYVATLPLIGRLADLIPRRRVLTWCLVVFAVGSVVTALATDLGVLVAGRVVQGVGGGGLVPATLALVADQWPPERRGGPLGVVGAVQELGAVAGPVLGAAILAVGDWRAIFWFGALAGLGLYAALRSLPAAVSAQQGERVTDADVETARSGALSRWLVGGLTVLVSALGALTLVAPESLTTHLTYGLAYVPLGSMSSRVATPIGLATVGLGAGLAAYLLWRSRGLLRRADLPSAALLAVALTAVILTFATSNPERDVVGPAGLALLPLAALAAALALWRLRRVPDPLIPATAFPRLTRRASVVSACVGVALVAVVVDVPVDARLTVAETQTAAAFVLVKFLVAVPVGALVGGWLTRRVSYRVITVAGLVAATGDSSRCRGGPAMRSPTPGATVVLVLVGLGLGLTLAPVNAAALHEVAEGTHGVAGSIIVVARMIGMVVGLAVLTSVGLHAYYAAVAVLPDPTDVPALLDAAVVQVQWVFRGAAVAAALGALAGLGLTPSRGSTVPR
ncbi:MAG: MFS transporter [Dermatophilaceae bacterium]